MTDEATQEQQSQAQPEATDAELNEAAMEAALQAEAEKLLREDGFEPDEETAQSEEQAEAKERGEKPAEEQPEKKPAEEPEEDLSAAEQARIAKAHAEVARQQSEVRRLLKDVEERENAIKSRSVTAEEAAANPLETLAKLTGTDPMKAYEALSMQVLTGKVDKAKPEDTTTTELQALRKELQSFKEERAAASRAGEEQRLREGVTSMITAGQEQYTMLNALGAEASTQRVTDHILRHYDETGDVLNAELLLKQLEKSYVDDLKRVVDRPEVRKLLQLAEKQSAEPNPKAGNGATSDGDDVVTLTNQAANEKVRPGDDDWQDDDKLVERAVAMLKRG